MYVHACMYACMHIYMLACVHAMDVIYVKYLMYPCICAGTSIHIVVSVGVMHAYVYVCLYACSVCMLACMYVRMWRACVYAVLFVCVS